MAVLEKIRSKSVFLLIVIGVALLAFIIGDFLNSGRSFFGAGTTVAKVDGTKISITDFQRRYEQYNQQLQASNQKVDGAVVQNQVLQDMVTEQLLEEEAEALGIDVTDAEITEAMTGQGAVPAVVQMARQLGLESPAQLHDLVFNPGKYGAQDADVAQVRAQWLEMEKNVTNQLKYQKIGVLLSGAIQANDLDKEAIAADMSTASTVDLVNVPYSSLDNKDFPVSDEELQARYEKEKSQFKTEDEIRKIHYIAVNIVPSQDDLAKAQKLFNSVDSTLRVTTGVESVRNISELTINQRTVRSNDVDAATREFIASAAEGAVSAPRFRSDEHSLVKLLSKKMDVDSVNVDMLQVQGAKKVQDSVLNLLNSGKPFAEVADNKVAGGQQNMWMNLMQMGVDSKSVEAKKKLLAAGSEYFVIDSNDNAALIYRVNEKRAPKQMYEIAEVSYKVFPSDETIDNLRAGLQKYISANNTAKLFADNAIASGYQALEAEVTAETPQINGIESTRKEVQWAFGAEKGSVSSIYDKEGNDKMIAVALDDIIPAGYMPLSDSGVRSVIETKVRNDKKGEKLLADYKGKASDLAGYAKLMNVPVDTAVTITFSQDFIPVLRNMESKLTAEAPYAKQGSLNGPVKGDQGVFVYKVVKNEKSSTQMTPEQLAQRYSMSMGSAAVSRMAVEILKENKDIVNNLIDFY
ncbi:MAG TPA: SurA N-terminal domain-containing protein [Candidatus Limisoma gallistercoris]|nr:SurA N-terminal domain-containing protein [Candidatus Limisoma gallistercoris]